VRLTLPCFGPLLHVFVLEAAEIHDLSDWRFYFALPEAFRFNLVDKGTATATTALLPARLHEAFRSEYSARMMILRRRAFRWIGSIACVCATTSCGSGETPNPLTGVLIDGPVSGISYETDALSGVTDEAGTFEYFEGETVRFFIGSTTLGRSPGQAQVSPFDLAGIDPPVDDESFDAVEESGDLFRAVNVAFLLQTLDREGNPNEGIEISTEVAALFEGVELDLDRNPERFRTDHDFRRILNQANAQSLFPAYRAIADLVAVMEHLYATLEIELLLTRPASQAFDDNADEMPDQIVISEFDDTGRMLAIRIDENADGTFEGFFEFEYDERGLVVGGAVNDSGMLRTVTIMYDIDHNPVRVETDENADGTLDEIVQAEYNEFGEVVAEREDSNADNIVDSITAREYDERGNEVLEARDDNANGVNDWLFSRQYDALDRVIREDLDSDGNGISERTTIFEYDEGGNLVRTAIDANMDGTFEDVARQTYDADGNLIRSERDTDGDGMPNSIETFEYDANGNEILSERDENADNIIDQRTTNTYDSEGNLIRTEFDENADDMIEQILHQTEFDAAGNVLRIESDNNADGVIDAIITASYATVSWGSVYRPGF
jgi:hypothetical protein